MATSDGRTTLRADDEELRLALVMNGGVSLAVWMGGVSYETSRVAGRTHPVYEGLQSLTRTQARIDVISGASAGGVNGAALAMSCTYDTSLYSLRDVWLEKGAFDQMLRQPSESDPASLLDGDGYFLEEMKRAFARLAYKHPAFSWHDQPIDLSLSTTRLHGEHKTRLDDLGAIVEDATHRERFHFVRNGTQDPFSSPNILAEQLARAARASASFPIAFEPFLCDPSDLADTKNNAPHDPNAPKVHLIDGGVLDNKPFDHALRGIRSMQPHRSVRRVLLYIIPDPAVSVARPEKLHGQAEYLPTLGEVGLASLVNIPAAQSIADQLATIRNHNSTVQQLRDIVTTLLSTKSPQELKNLAETLFQTYTRRRMEGVIDYVLEQLQLAEKADEPLLLGKRTRNWLRAMWMMESLNQRSRAPITEDYWKGSIPTSSDELTLTFDKDPCLWNWGLYSIEFLSSIVLDVFRRAQQLRYLVMALSDVKNFTADSLPSASNQNEITDWEDRDVRLRNERRPQATPPNPQSDATDSFSCAWRNAFAVAEQCQSQRRTSSEQIRKDATKLFRILRSSDKTRTAVEQREAACKWLMELLQQNQSIQLTRCENNLQLARKLGQSLLEAKADVDKVIEASKNLKKIGAGSVLRPETELSLDELTHLRDYFFPANTTTTQATIITQLLRIEVVQYSTSHRPPEVDALVELVQVSARLPSVLGGPTVPEEKVAGMQLAHFAAFYRKSWRANDWMVGRLDGIDRLVRVLLNPERLHALYAGKSIKIDDQTLSASDYVYQFIKKLALETADGPLQKGLQTKWNDAVVRDELKFLSDVNERASESLTASCDAIIRRLQMEVLCKEIPAIAKAVEDDRVGGADYTGFSARLARRFALLQPVHPGHPPLSPEDALQMFLANPIGKERMAEQVGSDLFLRTLSHAVTVLHSAAAGERSGLGPIRLLLKVLKLPVWLLYLLANRLLSESRMAAAFSTTVLVAGVILTVTSAMRDNTTELAVAGWSLIFGWVTVALIRQKPIIRYIIVSILLVFLVSFFCFKSPTAAVGILILSVLLISSALCPSWLTTCLIAMGAIWWTTGHPSAKEVIAAAGNILNVMPEDHSNQHIQRAELFLRAIGLMIVILLVILLGALQSRFRRPVDKTPVSGDLELDELQQSKQGLEKRESDLKVALRSVTRDLGEAKKKLEQRNQSKEGRTE